MANLLKRWWPGTEMNRRRQPFRTRISRVSNNFKGCQWECNAEGPWVIAAGDFTSCARLADDAPVATMETRGILQMGAGEAGLAGE